MIGIAALAFLAGAIQANADFCSKGSENIGGNWYCQPVKHIKYTTVGHSGSYNLVTGMPSSGTCPSEPRPFSGPLAPFDEDLAIHARGPMNLLKVAVYTASSSSKNKRDEGSSFAKHNHRHRRAVGDTVVATINGKVVSWANDYDGSSTTSTQAAHAEEARSTPTKNSGSESTSSSGSSSGSSSSGPWSRVALYDRDGGSADGLVFLNNMGGQGSGVFDNTYGNSLSYAAADASSGSKSAQTLSKTLKSNQEVVIFSDKKCDDGCGFYRDGIPAYYGWAGASKVFVFRFDMPDDGTSGWNMNMPALWFLNGRIPRTAQYAKSGCSCWESGCGEFDVFEVLASGSKRAKSTIHAKNGGGDSDYFERPVSGAITLAVVMTNNEFDIVVLDEDFDFGSSLSSSKVSSWTTKTGDTSVFPVA